MQSNQATFAAPAKARQTERVGNECNAPSLPFLAANEERAVVYAEHPADLKASAKMGELVDAIRQHNAFCGDRDTHALNVFLTRLLFCFYAEDTAIFDAGLLINTLQTHTNPSGDGMDQFFHDLFNVLNLKHDDPKRLALPAHFHAFPYVNGGLFARNKPIPVFTPEIRASLMACAQIDWADINPDIFGSMFQAVVDEDQRSNLGQHYTSVPNILKVITPLFLDELNEALDDALGNESKLKALLVRLQRIRVFDPSAGSCNFLIIAYKSLREFEMRVIHALNEACQQQSMYYSGIRLSQFYGIEIDDFAHEIGNLSMWLAEHQMNMAFKETFGYTAPALPLKDSGNIIRGNSLRLDWDAVCPKFDEKGKPYEVYVCGNPPFLGFKNRSKEQTEDVDTVFKGMKSYRSLDYVASFFWKGAQYIKDTGALALVSTNSICQGSQVATLWPFIFDLGLEINFAHTSFPWANNAKNKAAVHVVIVGLSSKPKSKIIYKEVKSKVQGYKVKNIGPYLIEGSNLVVPRRTSPLVKSNKMITGNVPVDGGNLMLSPSEKEVILNSYPFAEKWIRRILGSEEFINSKERYCLWLVDASENDINSIPPIKDRVEETRKSRLLSKDKGARKLADKPHLFRESNNPSQFILVPYVSSERRSYIPIGFFESGGAVISSNANQIIPNGTMYEFAILNSEIHNDWMRLVGSKMESRYRYSNTLVYNTFPWPDATKPQRARIEALAEEILLTREDYPTMTLAQLYDPDTMPAPLLAAHKALDRAVEKLYRKAPFRDASERLAHLFGRYEKLIEAKAAKKGN